LKSNALSRPITPVFQKRLQRYSFSAEIQKEIQKNIFAFLMASANLQPGFPRRPTMSNHCSVSSAPTKQSTEIAAQQACQPPKISRQACEATNSLLACRLG
jgi:hypothetical protein